MGMEGELRLAEKRGLFSTLRQERPLLWLMALVTLIYTFLSCVRQWRFLTGGWDLGVFDQMVWQLSRFQLPNSSLLPHDLRLGGHFSPVLALAAPFYWIFKTPEILFFLQSSAVALSAGAVFLFAQKRLGRTPAYLWTIAYAWFWGLQAALGEDFHPVSFCRAAHRFRR